MIKVVWLTAGCFLDHTFPLLSHLCKRLNVTWVVAEREGSFAAQHAKSYAIENDIELKFFYTKYKWYNPKSFCEAIDLMKYVSGLSADVYFFDYSTFPHLFIPMHKYMREKKLLLAMHHGKAHSGVRFYRLYNIYLKWLKNQNYFFQFFSSTQANLFQSDPKRKFVIQLPVNNAFGTSLKSPATDKVVFQFFGHMISTKNVNLLIQAACKLKEHTDKPFLVRIYGHCRNWGSLYQPLIKYPEIFDIRHESVPDEEIPDIFSSAHYLVQPYKTVTQSGPTKLAYGYHLPIIASDLPGFRESIVENVTGIFFKSENVDSLVAIMNNCLENHPSLYLRLRDSQAKYVVDNLTVETIIKQYTNMFERIYMMPEEDIKQVKDNIVKRMLNRLKENRFLLFMKMVPDMMSEYWRFSGMTVRCGLSHRKSNLQTEIMMLTHSVEKAFSLPNMRVDFGVAKVKGLYTLINSYMRKYGYDESLRVPISLMFAYQEFRKKHGNLTEEINGIMNSIIISLANRGMNFEQFTAAGVIHVTRQEMLSLRDINFERLASNRYAFRNFDNKREEISRIDIDDAINIAKKSPSACNRQAYRVHVYDGEDKTNLMNLQNGAKQFSKEADKVLLITGDMNRYYSFEQHLMFVDASLFAMSLMYALTAKGIASIPLTLCIKRKRLDKIICQFGIPRNELPIIMIAIGNYPEECDVARSERMESSNFTTYH